MAPYLLDGSRGRRDGRRRSKRPRHAGERGRWTGALVALPLAVSVVLLPEPLWGAPPASAPTAGEPLPTAAGVAAQGSPPSTPSSPPAASTSTSPNAPVTASPATPPTPPPTALDGNQPTAASVRRDGVAVVALGGATDAAWPLARGVYSEPTLRAAHLDEIHARVLCGELPSPDPPADLRDLADTVAAIRGDDAPSRALLAEIARQVGVRALLVVRMESGRPVAHVFLADTSAFDAAIYEPDPTGSGSWSGAVRSIARSLGTPVSAAPLATHPVPHADAHAGQRPFYLSPWLWGAVGLAALAAGAAFLVARDSGQPTIHLEVQVPPQ